MGHQHSSMRAFIVCLAIAAVSGDAKPYTVAQVAAGLPVQNALADGRLHNVGVITNAAEAGVKTVGAIPLGYAGGVYAGYPYASVYSGYPYVHYGKREAEAEADPYTIAQVATGQTHGGVITGISYGHGAGLVPAVGVVPHAAYSAYHPYSYLHAYGKREAEAEAEPYTIAQVATGQTKGGVITGIGYGHGTGLVPAVGVVPHVAYSAAYHPYSYLHAYGKREADPYTLEQVAHGKTAGGVVTAIDYGHGSGLIPATAVTHNTVAYVPAAYSALHAAVPAVYSTAYAGYPFTHYYG